MYGGWGSEMAEQQRTPLGQLPTALQDRADYEEHLASMAGNSAPKPDLYPL